MAKSRSKKTNRGAPLNILKRASIDVLEQGMSIRSVAKLYGLSYATLFRFCKKKKVLEEERSKELLHVGNCSGKKVFTEDQEKEVTEYLMNTADACFGLLPHEVRELVYQLAVKYGCKHPKSWDKSSKAGVDWLASYLKRNPTLSIRNPETTSLALATSFSMFFIKLDKVIRKHNLTAEDIWNANELGISTIRTLKVHAKRRWKRVGALTSEERDQLITLTFAVSATGSTVPPMFLFPHICDADRLVKAGPIGSIGIGNKSGWMQEEDFHIFLKHFVKHAKNSPEKKLLLLIGNHCSHLSVAAIDYCKNNGIEMMTFPPHCGQKLQPLDRSVYGTFKKMINSASYSWRRMNPRKTMTINDVPGLVSAALPSATTPKKIQAGFQCSGIWPYNPDIFKESELESSQVTDCLDPDASQADPQANRLATLQVDHQAILQAADLNNPLAVHQATPSDAHHAPPPGDHQAIASSSCAEETTKFNPVDVQPLLKARPTIRPKISLPMKGLDKKQAESAHTNQQRSCRSKQTRRRKKHKTFKIDPSDTDSCAEESYCIVCSEDFNSSEPNEAWVQCMTCTLWAHKVCTPRVPYICHHCDDDDPKIEMKVKGLAVQDIKAFLEFQVYPETAKQWQRENLKDIAENYKLERGRLYHYFGGMKRLVLESEEEIVTILSAFHVRQSGIHYNTSQMKDRICTRYYWPDMKTRIRKWVDGCEKCLNTDKESFPSPPAAALCVEREHHNANEARVTSPPQVGEEDAESSFLYAVDVKKQTSANGSGYLQCPYCNFQGHSKSSYQIHVGSNHPLHCDDMSVGRLGKVIFYQRTAKLFHCHICFFTSKSYFNLFDHILVNHCFSGKTLQTDDSEEVKSVADKAKDKGRAGEGAEWGEDCPEPGERSNQNNALNPDVIQDSSAEGDRKVPTVEEAFKSEEDQSTESAVTSGPTEESSPSDVSLKRKRSSASCSEEEGDEEGEEEEEELDGREMAKEEKDATIMEYVEQLSSRYYYCKFCKWRCKRKGFLVHHISQKHDVPKRHACKECNKTFMLETMLSSHVSSCHKQGLYQCPFCSFESNFLRGIRRHLNNCKAEEGGEGESVEVAEEKE